MTVRKATAKKAPRSRRAKPEPEVVEVAPDAFSAHGGIQFGRFVGMSFTFRDEMFDGKPGVFHAETNLLGRYSYGTSDITGGFETLRQYVRRFQRIDFSNPVSAISEVMEFADDLRTHVTKRGES